MAKILEEQCFCSFFKSVFRFSILTKKNLWITAEVAFPGLSSSGCAH